ncbi:uncharacterized protein HD556DRAFT_1311088 [Suillus plorans]|uniref:Choline/carnitine acyltransferase domain-containing protein n=1 Tax=Suillus plorans TaxID=116603 RepID=A0A9P7AHV2_9AGAM|nr:uncharacterized protein HD556DRAFT_1311088 [Suillus plorans]KAG1789687.1 hypothetical protein HD556DRAFT_1311088 [Suillus plorans]
MFDVSMEVLYATPAFCACLGCLSLPAVSRYNIYFRFFASRLHTVCSSFTGITSRSISLVVFSVRVISVGQFFQHGQLSTFALPSIPVRVLVDSEISRPELQIIAGISQGFAAVGNIIIFIMMPEGVLENLAVLFVGRGLGLTIIQLVYLCTFVASPGKPYWIAVQMVTPRNTVFLFFLSLNTREVKHGVGLNEEDTLSGQHNSQNDVPGTLRFRDRKATQESLSFSQQGENSRGSEIEEASKSYAGDQKSDSDIPSAMQMFIRCCQSWAKFNHVLATTVTNDRSLNKYYVLCDDAQDTMTESQFRWLDTPFSVFAVLCGSIAASTVTLETSCKAKVARTAIGVLTTENQKTWSSLRQELAQDKTNAACLRLVDDALFVVCLDDAAPGRDGIGALARNGEKGKDLAALCNGAAGISFEHTGVDGHTVLRFSADVFTEGLMLLARSINPSTPTLFHAPLSPHSKSYRPPKSIPNGNNGKSLIPSQSFSYDTSPAKLMWTLTPSIRVGIRYAETRLSDLKGYLLEVQRILIQLHRSANERLAPFLIMLASSVTPRLVGRLVTATVTDQTNWGVTTRTPCLAFPHFSPDLDSPPTKKPNRIPQHL